jgi:hypothetical protein
LSFKPESGEAKSLSFCSPYWGVSDRPARLRTGKAIEELVTFVKEPVELSLKVGRVRAPSETESTISKLNSVA